MKWKISKEISIFKYLIVAFSSGKNSQKIFIHSHFGTDDYDYNSIHSPFDLFDYFQIFIHSLFQNFFSTFSSWVKGKRRILEIDYAMKRFSPTP